MKNFRKYGGEIVNDLKKYILDHIQNHPETEIYIGTDSVDRKDTLYVTVICFNHPGNGAHVIYLKEHEKKSKNLYEKLWREVEKTREIGLIVKNMIPNKSITLDLDLNSLKTHASNIVFAPAQGYLLGLGFNVRTKPQAWSASCAADHLLK